jgi:pimeloyl-ACP methyl ester carboxylesterase
VDHVTAPDGAKLACWKGGSGPPLLLVHGSVSDRTVWEPIRPRLERRFTVHVMHRRGRDGSAPLMDGDLRREFSDVAAVIDAIGAPHVLGHSYGAVCALGAAAGGARVRSLMLYEPPALHPDVGKLGRALESVLEEKGADAALRTFLAAGPGEPPEVVERAAAMPLWQTMLSLVPDTPLELDSLSHPEALELERLRSFAPPALHLLGTESPAHFRSMAEALAEALPTLRRVELPGEGHFANVLSPDRFATEVLRFLDEIEAR